MMDELMMKRREKLSNTIAEMIADADMIQPCHLTSLELKEINDDLDNCSSVYQLGLIAKKFAYKPPQTAKYITVDIHEYDMKCMFLWKSSGNSSLCEIRLDDETGQRLPIHNWVEIERSHSECLKLAGIYQS